MPKKTALEQADSILPRDVRRGLQQTRERMDQNLQQEHAARESREISEQQRRDRELVARLIDEVTAEQGLRRDMHREIPIEESNEQQDAA